MRIPFPFSVEVLRSPYERKTLVDAFASDRSIASTLFDWESIVAEMPIPIMGGDDEGREPILYLLPKRIGRLVGYRLRPPDGPELGRLIASAGAWRGDGIAIFRPDGMQRGRVSVTGRAKRLLNLTIFGTLLMLFGRPRVSLPRFKVEIDGKEPFALRPFGFGRRPPNVNADDDGGVVVERPDLGSRIDGRLPLAIATVLMAHHAMTWPDAGIVLTDVIAQLAQLWMY